MLTIEASQWKSHPVFRLTGNLDANGVHVFEQEILPAIAGFPVVILNLESLNFLSSAGIRKLVALEKDQRKTGGFLILSGLNELVSQVLGISGLLSQFQVVANLNEAVNRAANLLSSGKSRKLYSYDTRQYHFSRVSDKFTVLDGWMAGSSEPLLHCAVDDLGTSMGFGSFAPDRTAAAAMLGSFISLPGFFICKPEQSDARTDYLLTASAGLQGVYLQHRIGTAAQPDGMVEFGGVEPFPLTVLIDDLMTLAGEVLRKLPECIGITGFVRVRDEQGREEIRLGSSWMFLKKEISGSSRFEGLTQFFPAMEDVDDMFVARRSVLMEGMKTIPPENSPQACLAEALKVAGVSPVLAEPPSGDILEGRLWLFLPESFRNFAGNRLDIRAEEGTTITDTWDLLIRNIYHDASLVRLQQLHGGFSARTFLVESHDRAGRKRLPTVLKLGSLGIIGREEKRYREYVRPFILNNSVSVLGANYYRDQGGICYNFLGIDGPGTKLRWLTHIYRERSAGELIPLFDRIFREILKPWYGQPRWDRLHLFKIHDPMAVFFTHLLEDAERVLRYKADEQYLNCPWLGRKVLNPYWYLKYKFSKRAGDAFNWYSAICHGDLNMQNILLDEKENIYIIDFSETGPTNAVSDFARLEPIFKIEMTRSASDDDLARKLRFEEAIVKMDKLGDRTEFVYDGDDPEVSKAYDMVTLVRNYARQVTIFEDDPLPYWLAVLQWTLPYVSYSGVSERVQRHATFSAGLICERLMD